MFSLRLFRAFAFCVCSFASAAFAQVEPEGRISRAELERSQNFAIATLEAIVDRATPLPAPPRGLVRNPQPSNAEQAADLAESLVEDASYRATQAFDSILSQGFEPEDIIDGDWTRVKNVEAAPFKAVCHIKTFWPDGKATHGTATFVGRRVLVTAGHCVWDKARGKWATSIRVTPARRGETGEPFGSESCSHLVAHEEWIASDGRDLQYDIAWLVMPDRKLQGRVDFHFGVWAPSAKRLSGLSLFSAGYPDPPAFGFRMYRDFEAKDQIVEDNLFHHYHDTLEGSSGSPLYVKSGDDYDIVGVHSHAPPLPLQNWNTAVRMTGGNVAKTRLYTQQFP